MSKVFTILLTVLMLLVPGCSLMTDGVDTEEPSLTDKKPLIELGIHIQPDLVNMRDWAELNPVASLPRYDPDSLDLWQVDLRYRDLSHLDLSGRTFDLLHSEFNSETIWPENLPEGFDPNKILTINKNPGLNIRKLHKQGITGKGIGIGIIDHPLVLNHIEFKDNIRYYDHVDCDWSETHFHGSLVSSIAVGDNLGVAPDADLYYVANANFTVVDNETVTDYTRVARAIERLVEVNQILPKQNKIRVISISQGFHPNVNGYNRLQKALQHAASAGIFVISANVFQINEQFHFHGLYKEALADPDQFESFSPYVWDKWIKMVTTPYDDFHTFYTQAYETAQTKKLLLIPRGGITAADSTGNDHYMYFVDGGWSSAIPYIAGLYVLSCQVKPEITPAEFWNVAYETGIQKMITKEGEKREARIPHPEHLITYLQEN